VKSSDEKELTLQGVNELEAKYLNEEKWKTVPEILLIKEF
jgi:hypothetical protein